MGIYFIIKVVKRAAYTLFLVPMVLSVIFGSAVLAQVLEEDPNRELNMMPNFDFMSLFGSDQDVNSDKIKIIGLLDKYDVSTPISIQLQIEDESFDCGDLYITIYDTSKTKKQTIKQRGFFEQCFASDDSLLPIGDTYSEIIDVPGNYQLVIDFKDKTQENSIISTFQVEVR